MTTPYTVARAVLIGIAVGDAFGTSLYHPDRRWVSPHNIDYNTYYVGRVRVTEDPNDYSIWSYKGYKPGNYTDTTEMTLGLCNALSDSDFNVDENILLEKWKEIFDNNTNSNCKYLKLRILKGGVIRAGQAGFFIPFNGCIQIKSLGNAPPMRAVPLGLLPPSLLASIPQLAKVNANATHPHPKAVTSSIIIAQATHYLIIEQGDHHSIIDYCLNHLPTYEKDLTDEETLLYLTAVNQLPPELKETDYAVLCGEQPTTSFPEGIFGLPSDAMRLAGTVLYLIKHSRSALEGLQKAVAMGGDVGTLAPVVVGILSGRHGLDTLPVGLVEGVENKHFIEATALKFVEKLSLLKK